MLNWETMSNERKPLGRYSPWVWAVELVRGCNLRCWHCSARILPEEGLPRFMSRATWEAMFRVIADVSPRTRLELGQCGEPTLHPELIDHVRSARRISLTTQILMHTNGVSLLKERVSLDELLEAGINVIIIDVYGEMNRYRKMIESMGVEWYMYDRPRVGTAGHRLANNYYDDPGMKLIVLRDCPEDRLRWRKSGRLSTFLNHIDWDAAMSYGLVPVRVPYERKCTIPMRFSSVDFLGNYLFCCVDFWRETAGFLGNVSEGVPGFKRYWFGRLMQSIRRRLHSADRKSIPYCRRCNCAFSKCDWTKLWPEGSFEEWWNGEEWLNLPSLEEDDEVFADGWERFKEVQNSLPSVGEEEACLKGSTKRIIRSTVAVDGRQKVGGLFSLDNLRKIKTDDS